MKEIELPIEEGVKLLEEFIHNNEDLESLEAIVDKFNIFSSLGIINQEIRHSNFLSWMLDPNETHNLSDYFINCFLKQAVFNKNSLSKIGLVEIDLLDLSTTQVLREWNNIDLLLLNEEEKLVCVIENKVDSKEHSNQLERYENLVKLNFPDFKPLFIFLTINGEKPENSEEFIPFSYRQVSELIGRLIERKSSQLNDEVNVFIAHYNEMIKRYIMEESEIQELCQKLYKKHKKAIDLVIKYRPDEYMVVKEVLEEIIDSNPSLDKDSCSKSSIKFSNKKFDFLPKVGEWTKSKRILLFEILNYDKGLNLTLVIGPGTDEIRNKIYNHIKDIKPFKNKKEQTPQYTNIYSHKLAKFSDLEGKSKEEKKEMLEVQFKHFMSGDFKLIEDHIKKIIF
jgi:hypothetical protein